MPLVSKRTRYAFHGLAYLATYAGEEPLPLEAVLEYLRGYSPLHNLKQGVAYPATLVTTADHDDRVVPAHSFKFAAQLQADQGGELPVLIRIESKAGHGAGTPVSKQVEQYADIFAFTLYNMGVEGLDSATP